MNKRGFTLIELVTVIALLGIISIIAFVSIFKVIGESKVSNCENLLLSIKSAAKEYASDNRYGWTDNGAKTVTALKLIEDKYLSSPITNPFDKTTTLNANDIKIIISLDDYYTPKNIVVKYGDREVNCNNNEW